VEMIFASRQLQEKFQEQQCDLYITLIDFTKAFDTVNRNGLWRVMEKFGCLKLFTNIVKQFHEDMTARVLNDGVLSDPFHVTNGVKQGCVLALTLFSMMFAAMLTDSSPDQNEGGVKIPYRTDGKLFNPRRLQAHTKVKAADISNLLFADDCALTASSETGMQASMDKFAAACDRFGFKINTSKTEVLFQPCIKTTNNPAITVNHKRLQQVDRFTYLDSILSSSANIDYEVTNRISKASSVFLANSKQTYGTEPV
jgi:hypothetical protein